jgi:hypothetical protein
MALYVSAGLLGVASGLAPGPMSPDMASSVAFLTLSASSGFMSLFFASLSSSLSPRLNGSLSPIGDGSTAESGCHLLGLAAELDLLLPPE